MTGQSHRSAGLARGAVRRIAWPRWIAYLMAAALSAATLVLRMEIAGAFDNRPLLIILVFPVILSAIVWIDICAVPLFGADGQVRQVYST